MRCSALYPCRSMLSLFSKEDVAMGSLLMLIGVVLSLVGFVCGIMILINAFQNEIWKGIVSILCGLYLLYYAFVEYDGDNKALILIGWLVGGTGGWLAMAAASGFG